MRYVADDLLGLQILLQNMEEGNNIGTKKRESISKVLRELVNPKHGKLRATIINQGIELNYLPKSIKILKDLLRHSSNCKIPEEMEIVESTIVNFLWFLSAIATNDSSFARHVRDMLKVKFFHSEVYKKIFFAKSASHYPLLKILRQLSKNDDTASILGKEGVMTTIRKSFSLVGTTPGGKLLIIMDILSQLTKKKTNSTRFQKAGLLVKVMQVFSNWELWRGQGLLRLSKFLISTYNHVARTPSGRKAIIKCDAILQIRKFCDACPSERSFDEVLMRISGLVATCYHKDILPLDKVESPIVFQVPDAVMKVQDCGSSSDDEGSDDGDEDDDKSDDNGSDDDVASSDDSGDKDKNNDNQSSDDDMEPLKVRSKLKLSTRRSSTGDHQQSLPSNMQRQSISSQDSKLDSYKKFFTEFEVTKNGLFHRKVTETKSTPMAMSLASLVDENLNETSKPKGIPRSEHKYSWITDNKDCEYVYWTSITELRRQYSIVANSINHVAPFVKIPYPDFAFAYSQKSVENMLPTTDRALLRSKIISYISRTVGGESFKPKVIYSLDSLLTNTEENSSAKQKPLRNRDEKEIGNYNKRLGLEFESRFESGNLRKAIQVGERDYDLLITSDVNSRHHNQWFYFQVSNTVNDKMYTFNIINCTKTNSLFNYGMQPLYYSVTDATKGKAGWQRSGHSICYYKNGYKCATSKKRNCSKVYHTLSFSLSFAHKGDIVYIAYHLPYPYTRLMVELNAMLKASESRDDIIVKYDTLCQSLNKNEVPLLTITSQLDERSVNTREIIFLTSRVHPGESNANWVMKGILEFLLFGKTSHVQALLKKYVFKIVPMLNVEGVINGCHRCGLTSEDLNRCWKMPSEILHPTIFHTKMLIEYCCKILNLTPALYCDLHGHSRRKNCFFYGCSFSKSWQNKDKLELDDSKCLLSLPESMDRISSAFCLSYCNYDVRKSRETTARVAVWRDYRIPRSYTLECSYCGFDRGQFKGIAFGTNHLLEIGKDLCKSCLEL
ncbi:cytosolic carboxypeptidase 1 isoform X2 [Folsomia candida]|nr:cytosolic carboxypeptidase 1 isoform X2 [Folsomia candida]